MSPIEGFLVRIVDDQGTGRGPRWGTHFCDFFCGTHFCVRHDAKKKMCFFFADNNTLCRVLNIFANL